MSYGLQIDTAKRYKIMRQEQPCDSQGSQTDDGQQTENDCSKRSNLTDTGEKNCDYADNQ